MPPADLPVREPPRKIPGFPFENSRIKRQVVAGEDLINPPYALENDWPNGISDRTAATDVSETLVQFTILC